MTNRLARRLLGHQDLHHVEAISDLEARRLLRSRKSTGYLHPIRVLGNAASHPSDESLTVDDVRIAAFALARVLGELLDSQRL